mgnify:CR=1 FL=1
MTQISRFKLKEETLEKLYSLMFEVLGKKSKNEFLLIMNDLVSPTEKIMISKRIAVIYLLTKNIDQRTIAHTMKVSLSTISKYALLVKVSNVLPNALSNLIRNEGIRLLISEIFVTLFPPGTPNSSWGATWELKKEIGRKKSRGF